MRSIDLFEYARLKDWSKCTDIRLYKKYVQNKENPENIEANISLCFTDEEGIRQCYNTVYFNSVPLISSNFDMKAMYVALEMDEGKKKFFDQVQFTEKYDNFVIFDPRDEIPFDPEGKTANNLELNVIDKKIFEDEEGYDTVYIFAFKDLSAKELLNIILLT